MAAAKTPMQDAARANTRLAVYQALRDRLCVDLDDPSLKPVALAALSRRLMETQNEIDALLAAAGDGPESGAGAQPGGGGVADAAATPAEPFPAT